MKIMPKPKILVLYYSQTGQGRQILESILRPLEAKADLQFLSIEPEIAYPFPWTSLQFLDVMPESVMAVPVNIRPLPENLPEADLVILGYQPWFLHPSIPITSFLKGEAARRLLKGKPVITVAGTRNMWLNAQERIKAYLLEAGAQLSGQIILEDKHPNLISLLTVMRWAFQGQKEASGLLPEAGISQDSIRDARRFGPCIGKALEKGDYTRLQEELLALGAVPLKSSRILLEKRGILNFRFWGPFIAQKGGPGDRRRIPRLRLFQYLLLIGIFILSPISALMAKAQSVFWQKSLEKDKAYFRRCAYEPGRI